MRRSLRLLLVSIAAFASISMFAGPANAMMCPQINDEYVDPTIVEEATCTVMKIVLGPVCNKFGCG